MTRQNGQDGLICIINNLHMMDMWGKHIRRRRETKKWSHLISNFQYECVEQDNQPPNNQKYIIIHITHNTH